MTRPARACLDWQDRRRAAFLRSEMLPRPSTVPARHSPAQLVVFAALLEASMTRTEKLLNDLIALPSVNPAFQPAPRGGYGERRVAEFAATVASRAGLDVKFQRVLPGRSNVLARLSPSGK